MTRTLVLDDPAEECAKRVAEAVTAGGHVVLTGGSTPRACYRLLAGMDLDWSGTTLWWSDERCVPPDDERSNYRMVKEALLDQLPDSGHGGPAVRPIAGERGPAAGADDYERELHRVLGEELPRLDLILLGLGPDAHVASLFPGQPTLDVRDRLAVGVQEAGFEPYVPRVSLTMPAINAARSIVFLVAGEEKSDAVARAFGGDATPEAPGSLVRPSDGELTILLDRGAASRLASPPE
ncbi:MAG: 6-phosphogluconolactonase [Thermoleophilaceae bacterium]|nr:6-phosphogluconolactonase [Thermoleophilaceae bacterium]